MVFLKHWRSSKVFLLVFTLSVFLGIVVFLLKNKDGFFTKTDSNDEDQIKAMKIQQALIEYQRIELLKRFAMIIQEYKRQIDLEHYSDAEKLLQQARNYAYLGPTVVHDLGEMVNYRRKIIKQKALSLGAFLKQKGQ